MLGAFFPELAKRFPALESLLVLPWAGMMLSSRLVASFRAESCLLGCGGLGALLPAASSHCCKHTALKPCPASSHLPMRRLGQWEWAFLLAHIGRSWMFCVAGFNTNSLHTVIEWGPPDVAQMSLLLFSPQSPGGGGWEHCLRKLHMLADLSSSASRDRRGVGGSSNLQTNMFICK